MGNLKSGRLLLGRLFIGLVFVPSLAAGGPALDAVEAAVRVMEDDPIFDAGRGSAACGGAAAFGRGGSGGGGRGIGADRGAAVAVA